MRPDDSPPTGDEARRRLHEIVLEDRPLDERMEAVLRLGVDFLGVETGHVAEIDVESGQWEAIVSSGATGRLVPEGMTLDLATTYCRHAIEREHPLSTHDVDADGLADDPAHEEFGAACYHGGAITIDDEIFGTVCFASEDARKEPFSDEERLFVDLAATLLGNAIQRERHRQHLREQRRQLSRQREEFRALIDASFDVVCTLDTSGTITYVSDSTESLLDYEADALVGRNYAELVPDQTAFEDATGALGRVLQAEPVEELSLPLEAADGRVVYFDVRAAPIYDREVAEGEQPPEWPPLDGEGPEDASVRGVQVVLRDATQRKRYEHLVSVLQRVLRHNLRNALNVIHGASEQLERDPADEGPMATISSTIGELLAISEKARQLESAVSEDEEPSAIPVDDLVERVCDRVGERYPGATVTCSTEPCSARATSGLERAVEEVVENAAKHGGESPTVAVTVRDGEREVVLTVTDDGPGLPDQERSVLTSGEESPLEHGSGLGHWFVYWFVTSIHGSVEVDETDSGTEVRLTLPAARSQADGTLVDSV